MSSASVPSPAGTLTPQKGAPPTPLSLADRLTLLAFGQANIPERTFAWLNQYRRLRIRYERRKDIHDAFLKLGCALICWKQALRFC